MNQDEIDTARVVMRESLRTECQEVQVEAGDRLGDRLQCLVELRERVAGFFECILGFHRVLADPACGGGVKREVWVLRKLLRNRVERLFDGLRDMRLGVD